jgi:8-oxo-dGTP pyrophosphatase MutT (NUDIX family)
MPHFASKKQYRMMMAILHGKKSGSTARGDKGPPKSVAEQYSGDGKNVPESKGKEREGGRWDEGKKDKHTKRREHEKNRKERLKQETKRLKEKHLGKSEDRSGFGVLVVDENGHVLMGRHTKTSELALPGGSAELGESPEHTVVRELEEETGLKLDPSELKPLDSCTFVAQVNSKELGSHVRDTSELSDVKFMNLADIDMSDVRDCCVPSLKSWAKAKNESLISKIEKAEKQLELHPIFDMPKKDCLTIVANALHRHLDPHVGSLKEDGVAKVPLSSYTIVIRKHKDGKRSGNIDDGGKTIHRFNNLDHEDMLKDIMSLFEWSGSGESKIKILPPEKLSDETIENGIGKMVDNYRSYNLGDIYDEVENIRQEIRQGNAVDLQQAEAKIMSLFDKLEERLLNAEKKHNSLANKAGDEIDEIEKKLIELQSKLESMTKNKPSTVEAISSNPQNPSKISKEFYPYLSKPKVIIKPDGHVIIHFDKDWTDDEKSNFLVDLKAKALKKKKK